jgi:hypothetical protein
MFSPSDITFHDCPTSNAGSHTHRSLPKLKPVSNAAMKPFFARHGSELSSRTHRHRFASLVNGLATVLPITIERAPSDFRTENSAQFSTGPSDSIAISGARKSQYWPVNAGFFVITGRENGEIGTAWRMTQSGANSSPSGGLCRAAVYRSGMKGVGQFINCRGSLCHRSPRTMGRGRSLWSPPR